MGFLKYRKGDIFLANLNPSKGKEPGKSRPVIIIQSDSLNEVDYPTCIVIPCSSIEMPETVIRPKIEEDFFIKDTFALLDQVRSIDVKKRLVKKIGSLSSENLDLVLKSLKENIL